MGVPDRSPASIFFCVFFFPVILLCSCNLLCHCIVQRSQKLTLILLSPKRENWPGDNVFCINRCFGEGFLDGGRLWAKWFTLIPGFVCEIWFVCEKPAVCLESHVHYQSNGKVFLQVWGVFWWFLAMGTSIWKKEKWVVSSTFQHLLSLLLNGCYWDWKCPIS